MSEQLFQIAIKGLVRNDKGEVLMVLIPPMHHNPAHWDFPGGRMDPGEKFLDTLKRELEEEIGVGYIGKPKQLMAFLTKINIRWRNPLSISICRIRSQATKRQQNNT